MPATALASRQAYDYWQDQPGFCRQHGGQQSHHLGRHKRAPRKPCHTAARTNGCLRATARAWTRSRGTTPRAPPTQIKQDRGTKAAGPAAQRTRRDTTNTGLRQAHDYWQDQPGFCRQYGITPGRHWSQASATRHHTSPTERPQTSTAANEHSATGPHHGHHSMGSHKLKKQRGHQPQRALRQAYLGRMSQVSAGSTGSHQAAPSTADGHKHYSQQRRATGPHHGHHGTTQHDTSIFCRQHGGESKFTTRADTHKQWTTRARGDGSQAYGCWQVSTGATARACFLSASKTVPGNTKVELLTGNLRASLQY